MKIPMNMGGVDRVLRGLIGAALIVVGMSVGPWNVAGVICLVAAAVMFLTAAVGWCPLYAPLRISTRRRAGGGTGRTLAA
jgi:hypothetical protein